MFRAVSIDEFDAILRDAPATAAFVEEFDRYDFSHDRRYIDAAVHDGALLVNGSLRTPAFFTLVIGDLTVADTIDLESTHDAGGLFIVLGDVRCRDFISDYEAAVFIDGDLDARESVLNAFSDSSFSVIGSLRAKLHIGNDMHIAVGAGAIVEYGIGYCAALGSDGDAGIIRPQHSEEATIAALALAARSKGYPFDEADVARLMRDGRPLFKS